jgi:hypothetical protein
MQQKEEEVIYCFISNPFPSFVTRLGKVKLRIMTTFLSYGKGG